MMPMTPNKPTNRSTRNILWSRLLTHSGDQAWDFGVPLALVFIFPKDLDRVAFYYLSVRFLHMLFVARVCGLMDQWNRLYAVKVGIGTQTAGVLTAIVAMQCLSGTQDSDFWRNSAALAAFGGLVAAGLLGSLGATMMEVAVAQDWLPTVVPPQDLAPVNSRLKQIDLGTELAAPVVAGLLLVFKPDALPLAGFFVIAAWNLVSFYPEYQLLKHVYDRNSELAQKTVAAGDLRQAGVWEKLTSGWRDFFAQPAAGAMTAYALLWVTILSPHGVLLAGWLKTEWGLSEVAIGLFRGLGAVFGLAATLVFPRVLARLGLVPAARLFIVFEAACLVAAGLAFSAGADFAWIFIVFILLSRVGLYGFSLGETEIRQTCVAPLVRGRVNGFASALTSLATLGVYGAGSLLGSADRFPYLIYASIAFVCLGAAVFSLWTWKTGEISSSTTRF